MPVLQLLCNSLLVSYVTQQFNHGDLIYSVADEFWSWVLDIMIVA